MSSWMLYGAYGFTGTLIAREAVIRGHRPLLAGRNQEKLAGLAGELSLDYLVLDLEDTGKLTEAVSNWDLVLHAAGPFNITSRPMIQACLAGQTDYLDISGEYYVLEDTYAFDTLAKAAGTVLISGVGFDIVPTDCLASMVANQLTSAVQLEIAIAALGRPSSGTVKTSMEIFSRGCMLRRNDQLEPCRYGLGAKEIQFSHGKKWTALPVPWADLASAPKTTNIPNITVYLALPPRQIKLIRSVAPFAQKALAFGAVRQALKGLVGYLAKGPGESLQMEGLSYFWASAADPNGNKVEAWLETAESYRFTALAALSCVEKTLASSQKGALTPAQAFGGDFVLEIQGTKKFDRIPM